MIKAIEVREYYREKLNMHTVEVIKKYLNNTEESSFKFKRYGLEPVEYVLTFEHNEVLYWTKELLEYFKKYVSAYGWDLRELIISRDRSKDSVRITMRLNIRA